MSSNTLIAIIAICGFAVMGWVVYWGFRTMGGDDDE